LRRRPRSNRGQKKSFLSKKAKIVQTQKQKIAQDYARKEQQVQTDKKIAHSHEITRSRLAILQARDKGVQKVMEKATGELEQLSKGSGYKDLLVSLILQGLDKLTGESTVMVQAREEDRDVAAEAIEQAKNVRAGTGSPVNLILDLKHVLPPSREKAGPKALKTCAGGVILAVNGGRIVCNNTLDVRLKYAFEKLAPQIRNNLFA